MKTIVWDLDDVLNDFTAAWLKFGWQVEHPDCRVEYAQLRTNPPVGELFASPAEYTASLDRFRLSAAARQLKPQPNILEWFHRHGGDFRHHVLTARPVQTIAPGAAWVFEVFGRWIRHFHFVPSPRAGEVLPPYETTKGQILAQLGQVDYFVDDSVANVAEAAKLGIETLLFPQPWNQSRLTADSLLRQITARISA